MFIVTAKPNFQTLESAQNKVGVHAPVLIYIGLWWAAEKW